MDSSILIIIAILVAVAFAVWKLGGSAAGTPKSRPAGAESELLRMTLGDKNKAERLIQYEMRKKPGISREEAARAAVESIRYDNR